MSYWEFEKSNARPAVPDTIVSRMRIAGVCLRPGKCYFAGLSRTIKPVRSRWGVTLPGFVSWSRFQNNRELLSNVSRRDCFRGWRGRSTAKHIVRSILLLVWFCSSKLPIKTSVKRPVYGHTNAIPEATCLSSRPMYPTEVSLHKIELMH